MQYSRLEFSVSTDRPIAIAGLETRLLDAFETRGGFGVFERYLGRSLLWTRAPDVDRLTRITSSAAQASVPSWSWMAYEGGISFLDLPFGEIEWTADTEFRSPYSQKGSSRGLRGRMSSSSSKHPAELRVVTRSFHMVAASSSSGIIWDDPNATHDQLRCVVIGRLASESGSLAQKHWVVVLRELRIGLYERVGAGCLPKDKMTRDVKHIDSSVV